MIFDVYDLNRQFGKIVFKSGGSAPVAPDPVATAQAQTAANEQTAITQAFLNATDEFGPQGSREFEGFLDPESGEQRFRATTTLSPDAQAAFEAEQEVARGTNLLAAGQIGRVGEAVSDPFSFGGIPDAPLADEGSRAQTQEALFARQRQFLDPRFDQEQRSLETQLVNQGIPRNSDAFRRELENFNRRKDAAFADARSQSILAGGAEQSRVFGLESAARERGIQERAFERNIPLNEIAALLGTGQVSLPQFGAPPQTAVAGTDVLGAQALTQRAQQATFGAQSQAAASGNAATAGLAGAGLTALAIF